MSERYSGCTSQTNTLTEVSRRDVLVLAGAATSGSIIPALIDSPARADSVAMPTAPVALTLNINGQRQEMKVDPRQSLLDLLREKLDLTGTKKGCNQGACGACTILVNGRRIVSCLTLAVMHEGSEITTIEGLAPQGELHPLQEAFIKHEGFQCGYCTLGQIMSAAACISEGHAHSANEIQFWMSGNICRCGAYPGIVAAIADVAGRT